MSLLLDTHVVLWWWSDPTRLSFKTLELLGDPAQIVHVSAASVWEMSIKEARGRLDLDGVDPVRAIEEDGFLDLPVRGRHAVTAGRLPRHHDDPFDRMLVAQALAEDLTLVTSDVALRRYEVPVMEA